MIDHVNLAPTDRLPAGTPEDPIAFGALRLFRDGEQLIIGRRQGRDWLQTAVPHAGTAFALRVADQDGDQRRWAVELRDTTGQRQPEHLFFYRENMPYGLPGGIRAWGERLGIQVLPGTSGPSG